MIIMREGYVVEIIDFNIMKIFLAEWFIFEFDLESRNGLKLMCNYILKIWFQKLSLRIFGYNCVFRSPS